MAEIKSELKSGLTWRSFLGVMYAVIVFMPAAIWLYLMTNNLWLISAMQWATLFLFVELSRLSGKPLSKQEALIILTCTAVSGYFALAVGGVGGGYGWVYAAYVRNSPITTAFGLTDLIPDWWAPSPVSGAWEARTFLHHAWIMPITISLLSFLCTIAADISLGLLARQLYVEEEKLPFPLQMVSAAACVTLTGRESRGGETMMLSLGSIISIIYALVLYGIPFILRALRYQVVQIIPAPWLDLNFLLETSVPGASFGIATDILYVALGFILTFDMVLSMFIGSFACYFVGNHLLLHFNWTQWADPNLGWSPGMRVAVAWERSVLYAWAVPIAGLAIASGLMPVIRRPEFLIRGLKGLRRLKGREGEGDVPLWLILAGFLGGTVGSVILTHFLIPDSPIWVLLLLSTGWSFVFVLISTRALGETGLAINVPYVNFLAIMASGYTGAEVWFAPLVIQTSSGAPQWCGFFKMAELTKTNHLSLIKTWLIAATVAIGLSFLYTSVFWTMSPIPSEVYPGAEAFWPTQANIFLLWVSRKLTLFNPSLIAGGFGVGAILYSISDFLHLPISMIGIAAGTVTPIPITTTFLIGGVMGKIMGKVLGRDRWNAYKIPLAVGMFLGQGLLIASVCGIAIAAKSTWIMPY